MVAARGLCSRCYQGDEKFPTLFVGFGVRNADSKGCRENIRTKYQFITTLSGEDITNNITELREFLLPYLG